MADRRLYLISWLLQSLVAVFSLENAQGFEAKTEKYQVHVKNCCLNEFDTTENCNKTITLDWNYLRQFRIPRTDNTTSIILDSTLAVKNVNVSSSLECDGRSTKQFTIPRFNELAFHKSYKGFFAFFSKDGHFQYDENILNSKEFCIHKQESIISEDDDNDHIPSEAIIVSVCTSRVSKCSSVNFLTTSCIVRCCNYGEAWIYNAPLGKYQCVDSGEKIWKPKIYADLYSDAEVFLGNEDSQNTELPITMVVHARDLYKKFCKASATFQSFHVRQHANEATKSVIGGKPFKIVKDGTVWIKIRKRKWVQLLPGEYCIDGFQYQQGNYSGDNDDSILFECKDYEEGNGNLSATSYSSPSTLGLLSLALICLIYSARSGIFTSIVESRKFYGGMVE